MDEPGGLYSMGSRKSWTQLSDQTAVAAASLGLWPYPRSVYSYPGTLAFLRTGSFLLSFYPHLMDSRIPEMAEPGGLLSVGSHRAGHD